MPTSLLVSFRSLKAAECQGVLAGAQRWAHETAQKLYVIYVKNYLGRIGDIEVVHPAYRIFEAETEQGSSSRSMQC